MGIRILWVVVLFRSKYISKPEIVYFTIYQIFVKGLSIKHFFHIKKESRVYLDGRGFTRLLSSGLYLKKRKETCKYQAFKIPVYFIGQGNFMLKNPCTLNDFQNILLDSKLWNVIAFRSWQSHRIWSGLRIVKTEGQSFRGSLVPLKLMHVRHLNAFEIWLWAHSFCCF